MNRRASARRVESVTVLLLFALDCDAGAVGIEEPVGISADRPQLEIGEADGCPRCGELPVTISVNGPSAIILEGCGHVVDATGGSTETFRPMTDTDSYPISSRLRAVSEVSHVLFRVLTSQIFQNVQISGCRLPTG